MKKHLEEVLKTHLKEFKVNYFTSYCTILEMTLTTISVYHKVEGKSRHCLKFKTLYGWRSRSGLIYENLLADIKSKNLKQ